MWWVGEEEGGIPLYETLALIAFSIMCVILEVIYMYMYVQDEVW